LQIFTKKMRKYLKDKIHELPLHSKNMNIGDLYKGTNQFKKCYQCRHGLVEDKMGYLHKNSRDIW
jgi:cytochrome c2